MRRRMRRRRFLKLSLFSAASLATVGAVGAIGGLWGGGDVGAGGQALPAELTSGLRCLSASEAAVLQAAMLRILDGAEPPPGADGAVRQCLFADGYLGGLDRALRGDFKSLLSLLQLWPLVAGYGGRFTRLGPGGQDAVLAAWQGSRWALLRQGLQGLRALCTLSHYQDERSFAGIGYSGPLVGRVGR